MPPAPAARDPRKSMPAALASLLVVAGIAAGLEFGLGASVPMPTVPALQAILLSPAPRPPPPPPARHPRHRLAIAAAHDAGRAAAPPVPPIALIPLATPTPVLPVPTPAAGTAGFAGAGNGTASSGSGTGGGGTSDNGAGGSPGPATPAVQVSGRLSARDLPHDVLPPGGSLSVGVAYTVDVDGRVRDCIVTASSGQRETDALVCRLLVQRFRYRPARDRTGNPVPSPVRETHSWARRAAAPASAG